MAKKKKDTTTAFSIQGFDMTHYRRTEAYTTAIENLYAKATTEISNAVASGTYDPDKPFAFSDYPRIASYVKQVMTKLASNVQAVISEGSRREWLFACRKNDEFIKSIMDTAKLTKKRLEKMQDRNLDALKSFQTRKVEGLDLSQRVWKYTDQYRAQLELGLDVGLGEGRSAQQLARDVKQNLKYPDKLFRRVRDKRGNLQLSKAAKAFHPGTGVYRSSVKNAQRLTRSEINMAYRESDYLRWQQLDFVVGFDVHRSNHEPLCKCDLCAQLVGRYPKTFKFKGWHPQCMCYATPVLMDDDTFDANELGDLKAALRGTSYRHLEAKNAVTDVPENFKEWVESHKEQQQGWKSVPYFIRDNFVDGLLEEGLKANVLPPPDPFKPLLDAIMPQVEQARALCKEWGLTAASGAMESGIAQKDIGQVKAGIAQATGEALNLEKELNAWLKQIQPLLPVAKSYGINVDSFAGYVAEATGNHAKWAVNRAKWRQAVTELENAIAEAKDNEKLSSLLVDVAGAKAKYGSEAVHKVYDAVEKKLADISGMDGSLEYMKKKLEFEIGWVEDKKKYETWPVAQKAYQKKLDEVNYQLEVKALKTVATGPIAFLNSSKSPKGKQLVAEFESLIQSNAGIATLQSKLNEIDKFVLSLQKRRKNVASGVSGEVVFKSSDFTKERKMNALWETGLDKYGHYNRATGHAYFFPKAVRDWSKWSSNEREVAYNYTSGSSYINEPLYTNYMSTKYGVHGERRDSWEDINTLTDMIDKAEPLQRDVWLNRGQNIGAFTGQFGIDLNDSAYQKNPSLLVGRIGENKPFTSCAHTKAFGFVGNGRDATNSYGTVTLNIYCPKGTKCIYTEPYSAFGNSSYNWDGQTNHGYNNEIEVILQRGAKLKITKAEYREKDKHWFIDCDLIGQPLMTANRP